MAGSNLFHSSMTLGLKEFQKTALNELTFPPELLIDGSEP